ncbi:MAG: hypothetical protein IH881_15325 [Myxococcales bacterium]|nr:hypothetical protein [Myxococcales bacterium]
MSQNGTAKIVSTLLICFFAISSAQSAMACSVCYGDPNSPMTKGVQAGVLVLLGVVGTVLLLLASLLLFWIRRSAELDEAGRSVEQTSAAWASEPRVSS